MNILVCIKQVPDMDSELVIGSDGRTVTVDDTCEYRINRFDEFAVEAALALRDTYKASGASGDGCWAIDLITVGPARASAVLKRGVGMGADQGIHILCDDGIDYTPFQTAGWIAGGLIQRSYDLILTGAMTEDLMQGQTGPILASLKNIPSITSVISIEPLGNKQRLNVERELDGGDREILQVPLPVLLAVQPGINRPRYPSLSNLLRANRAKPYTVQVSDLAAMEPRQGRLCAGYPGKKRAGKIIAGTVQQKAAALLTILYRKSLLRR